MKFAYASYPQVSHHRSFFCLRGFGPRTFAALLPSSYLLSTLCLVAALNGTLDDRTSMNFWTSQYGDPKGEILGCLIKSHSVSLTKCIGYGIAFAPCFFNSDHACQIEIEDLAVKLWMK